MIDDILKHGFKEIFTPEEWDLWVKGEFNLFDNFVERVEMSQEDADRLRARFKLPSAPPKKTLTKSEVKFMLNDNERNNT